MAFPWLPLVQALIESQVRRGDAPTKAHAEDLQNVAAIATSRDAVQDAEIISLKKRVEVLERSINLMLRARNLAGGD